MKEVALTCVILGTISCDIGVKGGGELGVGGLGVLWRKLELHCETC